MHLLLKERFVEVRIEVALIDHALEDLQGFAHGLAWLVGAVFCGQRFENICETEYACL